MSLRIGERVDLPKDDTRHRLNQLADSKFDEEESLVGPVCFGPHICSEPFPARFTLPRDMPKYTGAVKPEDWLSDYITAIDITGGNKRTAVCYAPLMLTGSTRTWLNSLPALQINSWHDFQEAFIKTSPGLTSDHPTHGSWPSASKVRMSQTVTTSRDGPSWATHAKEWARSRPLATSRTDAKKGPC
jgi:hypothetical protein